MNISGGIITYNEAAIIEKPIKSLQNFCDETIILDSYSDDNTPSICQNLGCEVYQYEFDNFRDQKNRLIELCNNDWVFILDADEWCSPDLINNMAKILEQCSDNYHGYDSVRIPRYNIERGASGVGWPDLQTRLMRNYVRHADNPIHPGFINTTRVLSWTKKENGFIYQEKSYDKQEERYRMYYTLRAIDYKPFRLPDNIDISKANYENRYYIDAWQEWYSKTRQFNEIKKFHQ